MTQFAAPRKSLGQNFLQDQNLIRKIVAALAIGDNDRIIEIGPGRGALTDLLIAQSKDLHLIEFDRDLSRHWQQKAKDIAHLNVHESDVLKFDFDTILDRAIKAKVIGNLPYNISSPVLFHLMAFAEMIDSQVLMLQKEVVQRMCATPGGKQFGRLSVMMQYRYRVEHLFNVPPGAFFPPPKVDSAIVKLTPRIPSDLNAKDLVDLERVVKQAFSQRRKTLRNTLKPLLTTQQIESLGIEPSLRAESLTVAQFVDLSNLVTQNCIH